MLEMIFGPKIGIIEALNTCRGCGTFKVVWNINYCQFLRAGLTWGEKKAVF